MITFKSTKVIQTGLDRFEADGDFTIRGVTKTEKLTVAVSGQGTGSGAIKGTMAFDRQQYGMNSGIPFIKIADRVQVTVDLKVSGSAILQCQRTKAKCNKLGEPDGSPASLRTILSRSFIR